MYPQYDDIISRIAGDPLWFDEHGVPRYCEFSPDRSASIYISEIALAEIACQACRRKFKVALSPVNHRESSIAEGIKAKTLHYGDPPNIGCCDTGPSMNSSPLRVIEYWKRHHQEYVKDGAVINARIHEFMAWKRNTKLEIDINPDWSD